MYESLVKIRGIDLRNFLSEGHVYFEDKREQGDPWAIVSLKDCKIEFHLTQNNWCFPEGDFAYVSSTSNYCYKTMDHTLSLVECVKDYIRMFKKQRKAEDDFTNKVYK